MRVCLKKCWLNPILDVCFITSSSDDPVHDFEHPRLHVFQIDEGFVRDWLFANIETDVMVMTMPDLHQYQVKRSRHAVHYVYTQHSLVSFHMVYRPGAFDHYDTIFCSGPHHLREMRAIEALYDLPEKHLFEHGYARLDSIVSNRNRDIKIDVSNQKHYLLAPSWGESAVIESGLGEEIVELVLGMGEKLTLRPHPMTLKFAPESVQAIVGKHKSNPNFFFEDNVQGQDSLHNSDVMICDWSGAALDYAFGLEKPVIFIDVPRKVNNPNYSDVDIEPFEVSIRDEIGTVISADELGLIRKFKVRTLTKDIADKYVFNIGESDKVGARELIRLVDR